MLRHVVASSLVIHLVFLSSLIPSTVAQDYSGTGYVIGRPENRYYHEDVDDAVYNSKPYISGEKKPDTYSHSQVKPSEYDKSGEDDKEVTVVPRHVGIFSQSKEDTYPYLSSPPEYNKEPNDKSDGSRYSDYEEDYKPPLPYSPDYNKEPDTSKEVPYNNKPDVSRRKKADIFSNSYVTSYPSLQYPPDYYKRPNVSRDVPQYLKAFSSRRKKPDTYRYPQGNSYPSSPSYPSSSPYPRDYDDYPDDTRKVGKIPRHNEPDSFRRYPDTPTYYPPYPKKQDDRSKRVQQRYKGEEYRQYNPSSFRNLAPGQPVKNLVTGAGKIFNDIVKDYVPKLINPLVSPFFHGNRPKRPVASYEDGEKSYEVDEREYIPYSADGYKKPTYRESSSLFKKGSILSGLFGSFYPKTKKCKFKRKKRMPVCMRKFVFC